MALPVVFSPRARRQLAGIERYLAQRFSARNAARYVKAIYDRCQRLALAPHQGTLREDLRPGLRIAGYDRTVSIVFKVNVDAIRISSITYRGRPLRC